MTRIEKINTYLSVLAILLSVITPFVTYRLLDPSLQAYNVRGKLQVIADSRWSREIKEDKTDPPDTYKIYIRNVGELPAEEIRITAAYSFNEKQPYFTVFPPVEKEVIVRGGENYIAIKPPLAPKDGLIIEFFDIPMIITVTSKSGDITTFFVPWYNQRIE